MKLTFNRLPEEKKQRIINACINEFGSNSYEKSSTDRIIKKAGISKGGLYEYISSKEELFLYIVNYGYEKLNSHLGWDSWKKDRRLPLALVDRMYLYAENVIDFYITNPAYVSLIVNTHKISERSVEIKVDKISREHFNRLFEDCDFSTINIPKRKALDIASWLIMKTRYDFLSEIEVESDIDKIKEDYLANWTYVVRILRYGITGMTEGVRYDME
ncbi:MAG: TetR/AcrR family transcriptional regulator [Spirochaetales bacterium]|nr:TetR/AcrR family transcriptional regulator [Spirochaetales bacterium]